MTASGKIIRALLVSTSLLFIPLTASFFVDGWLWTFFDYVFAWVVFSLVSLAFTYTLTSLNNATYKIASALAIIATFLLVWINAAVGIIGHDNGSNLLYFFALAIVFMIALLSRFQPRGMARAMFSTGIILALIPIIALFFWMPQIAEEEPGIGGIFILNTFFAVLFLVSAALFRRASTQA